MLPNSRFNQPEREKSIKVTDYNVCRNNTRIWKQKSNHPHPLETGFFFPSNRNSAPHICMNCFVWSPWACFIHYKMRRLNKRKPKIFPVLAGDGWVSSTQTPVSSYAEHSKFSKHCSTETVQFSLCYEWESPWTSLKKHLVFQDFHHQAYVSYR